jgi:hypothetical protein
MEQNPCCDALSCPPCEKTKYVDLLKLKAPANGRYPAPDGCSSHSHMPFSKLHNKLVELDLSAHNRGVNFQGKICSPSPLLYCGPQRSLCCAQSASNRCNQVESKQINETEICIWTNYGQTPSKYILQQVKWRTLKHRHFSAFHGMKQYIILHVISLRYVKSRVTRYSNDMSSHVSRDIVTICQVTLHAI